MVNIERTVNAQSMGYNWRGSGERGDFVLISGLSERFEVDSWVVKVSGQSRNSLFKKRHP